MKTDTNKCKQTGMIGSVVVFTLTAAYLCTLIYLKSQEYTVPQDKTKIAFYIPQAHYDKLNKDFYGYAREEVEDIQVQKACISFYLAASHASAEAITSLKSCESNYICIVNEIFVHGSNLPDNWIVLKKSTNEHSKTKRINNVISYAENTDQWKDLHAFINDENTVYCPLGTASMLSRPRKEKTRKILIEPHGNLLEKAIPVLTELHFQHGFELYILGKEDRYSFIKQVDFKALSYMEYLNIYNDISLFFSLAFDGNDLEALQQGIPVIKLREYAAPIIFRHFKNSVLISTKQSAAISAQQIVEFFDERFSLDLSRKIIEDADAVMSAETFGVRLQKALIEKRFLNKTK